MEERKCSFCSNTINADELVCDECKVKGITGVCTECGNPLYDSDYLICEECEDRELEAEANWEESNACNELVSNDIGFDDYCNCNFKQETMEFIEKLGAKEIDEVHILYVASFPYRLYRGTELNWEKMAEAFGLDPKDNKSWDYDSGFGGENYMGWITFKDTSAFMERKEYDGSEWWESVRRPTLKDYEREDERLLKDLEEEEDGDR